MMATSMLTIILTMMTMTATVLLTAMAPCETDDNDDDNDCDDDGDNFLYAAGLIRIIYNQRRSNWPRPCKLSFPSSRPKWKPIITPPVSTEVRSNWPPVSTKVRRLPLVRKCDYKTGDGTGSSGWSYAVALDDDDGGSAAGTETAGGSASR